MSTFPAVVRGSRIELSVPSDLIDGTEVSVKVSVIKEKIGLDESEWEDTPEAIHDWRAWLATIEPVEFAAPGTFEEEFRRFNIEAVEKQMSGELLPDADR